MSTDQDVTSNTRGSAAASAAANTESKAGVQAMEHAELPLSSDAPPSGSVPSQTAINQAEIKPKTHRDATRYGDWELKGRCIDF